MDAVFTPDDLLALVDFHGLQRGGEGVVLGPVGGRQQEHALLVVAQAAQLRFEIEFCERFLPRGLDDAAVRALVRERLAALGITDVKQVGRVVGDVMKTHKGQVEAGDVKRIAEELLQP